MRELASLKLQPPLTLDWEVSHAFNTQIHSVMAVTVTKAVALAKYKSTHNISKVLIKKSKTSGKLYAVTEDLEFIGMLLPDFSKDKDIFILTFLDSDSGESWNALGNSGTTSEPIYTL